MDSYYFNPYHCMIFNREFTKLTQLTNEKLQNDNLAETLHLGEGCRWSYFSRIYQPNPFFVYPSIGGRIKWMVHGSFNALTLVVYHLYLMTVGHYISKIPRDSLTWGQWSKQLGILLARDGLEALSYLVAPFHYQYAHYLVECHRMQKFSLLRMHDEKGNNDFRGHVLEKFIKDANPNADAYLRTISYEEFYKILYLGGIINEPMVQQYLKDWSEDGNWIKTDFLKDLKSKLSAIECSLKYIEDISVADKLLVTTLEYLKKTKSAPCGMAKLSLLIDNTDNKNEWCKKICELDVQDFNGNELEEFETYKKEAQKILEANKNFIIVFEQKKNEDIVSCEKYFNKIIDEHPEHREDENKPLILEFGKYLLNCYKKNKEPLCLKLAYKIFVKCDFDEIFVMECDPIPSRSIRMDILVAEQIAEDLESDWKELLKLQYKLWSKESSSLISSALKAILNPKEISERNFQSFVKAFKLLEYVGVSREDFRGSIENYLPGVEEGLQKINVPYEKSIITLLPKDKEQIKNLVTISPKFFTYCHPDIFKDKEFLLEIAVQNIFAITLADISLHTIEPLNKEILERFHSFFLCNKRLKNKGLPKILAYRIFAHILTNEGTKAESLAGLLKKGPNKDLEN